LQSQAPATRGKAFSFVLLYWLASTAGQVVALGAQHPTVYWAPHNWVLSFAFTCTRCESSYCSWCSASNRVLGITQQSFCWWLYWLAVIAGQVFGSWCSATNCVLGTSRLSVEFVLTHGSHSASRILLGSSQQGSLFDVLACRRLRSSSYSSMGPVLLHTSSQCFSVLSWQALPCATSRCLLVWCWPQWVLHSCFEGVDGAARSCCPTQLSACTIEGASP